MVAFPMDNGWQGHHRKIAERDLESAGGQPEFSGRTTKRFQARPISRCVAKLANSCQRNFAAKMAADHADAGGAAIHLVDLSDLLQFPNFSLLSKVTFFIDKRRLGVGFLDRLLPVECQFVVPSRFGREQFFGKIERNARFRFRLVLSQAFVEELAKLRIALLQTANRVGIECKKLAIRKSLDRSRATRTIQDRELAKKIAITIKGEIPDRAIVLGEGAGAAFFQDVHWSGSVALFYNEVTFLNLHPLQFLNHST